MIAVDVVVFDVDDTLYLERDYVRSGFRHLEAWCSDNLAVAGVGVRAWNLFEVGVRGTTITDALSEVGVVVDDDLRRRVVEQYREHRPDIELLPDAEGCLRRLATRVHLRAITDGPAVSQRAKLHALGLDRWIPHVVVTSEHGLSKPDPRVYEIAAASVGDDVLRFAYVADNPAKDFQAPLALGWEAVRVRRPGALHASVPTPAGVHEIVGLDELVVRQ